MTTTEKSTVDSDRRRLRGFRLLWGGDLVSQLGSQITLFVLPLLVISTLGATATEVGVLQALYTAPFFALPLFAGVWLERRARRPVMITMDLCRAALLLTVPLAAWLDALTLTQLYVVALAVGSMSVVFDIAAASYLPRLVAAQHLDSANSKLSADQAVGSVVGPGIAGWLNGIVGSASTVVLDALSYGVSAVCLLGIRHREVPTAPVRRDVRRELVDGLRAVFGNRHIRSIAVHAAIYNAGIELVTVGFLVHFVRDLGLGSGLYGVVMVVGGLGAVCGALLAPAVIARVGYGNTFLAALVLSTTSYFLLPWAAGSAARATSLAALGYFLGCVGSATGSVVSVTLRQRLTPPHLHARMTATYRLMNSGAVPVGAALSGVLVDSWGAGGVLWIAPVVLMASALPVVFGPVRSLRTP
ncbi:MFS transporter [Goodfellowiella coeruleoviolacea]|uniref:Arabinose efflux permease, MFS family n=1 Tax=Goodfellowiella coeruleoviolacea TaxID=334858 RepID=A0AAE3GER1_9PSEU|nr:MFS transporter [Goodfellowiella coeruleoviolacea]MCP2166907.1 putative arabinose efflux permease, MFS family [Goodfellowiella coeruleoviolacea]